MSVLPIIEDLERWTGLLQEIAEIPLDPEAEPAAIHEALGERQKLIEEIQSFDASLREIASLRSRGWPGVDPELVSFAEALIDLGINLARGRAQADQQTMEIANKKRSEILEKLRQNNLTKGYGNASRRLVDRPPAIVDDNA